jgi:hypothetical protein
MKNKCPCCGYLTIPEKESWGHICPVCFWEIDGFLKNDDQPSYANHGISINEAKANYKKIGACVKEMLPHVRKPKPEEMNL